MGVERFAAARSIVSWWSGLVEGAAASPLLPPRLPIPPKRAICDSALTRGARSSGRPPPVVCNHGRRLVWPGTGTGTGTKAAAIPTFPSAARFTLFPNLSRSFPL